MKAGPASMTSTSGQSTPLSERPPGSQSACGVAPGLCCNYITPVPSSLQGASLPEYPICDWDLSEATR